jgi:hypothetical protein
MIKNVLLALILCAFTASLVNAQVSHAQWKLSAKKISDCEYDLVFTVNLDKGWHTFSIEKIKGAEDEVAPTEIKFKPNRDYALVGGMKETKPKPEYDKTIGKTVLLHYNKVVFTQRIRLNSAGQIKVSGTYENQVCNDVQCDTPPYEKFDFDLVGALVCSKPWKQ